MIRYYNHWILTTVKKGNNKYEFTDSCKPLSCRNKQPYRDYLSEL